MKPLQQIHVHHDSRQTPSLLHRTSFLLVAAWCFLGRRCGLCLRLLWTWGSDKEGLPLCSSRCSMLSQSQAVLWLTFLPRLSTAFSDSASYPVRCSMPLMLPPQVFNISSHTSGLFCACRMHATVWVWQSEDSSWHLLFLSTMRVLGDKLGSSDLTTCAFIHCASLLSQNWLFKCWPIDGKPLLLSCLFLGLFFHSCTRAQTRKCSTSHALETYTLCTAHITSPYKGISNLKRKCWTQIVPYIKKSAGEFFP